MTGGAPFRLKKITVPTLTLVAPLLPAPPPPFGVPTPSSAPRRTVCPAPSISSLPERPFAALLPLPPSLPLRPLLLFAARCLVSLPAACRGRLPLPPSLSPPAVSAVPAAAARCLFLLLLLLAAAAAGYRSLLPAACPFCRCLLPAAPEPAAAACGLLPLGRHRRVRRHGGRWVVWWR